MKIESNSIKFIILGVLWVIATCSENTLFQLKNYQANRAPSITEITSTPAKAALVPNLTIQLVITASDPDGNPITYDYSADIGSFSSATVTDTGATVTYVLPGTITPGFNGTVTVKVTDSKSASASKTYNLGTAKSGPTVSQDEATTLNTFLQTTASRTISFSSDSKGFYQVRIFDDPTASCVADETDNFKFYKTANSTTTVTIYGRNAGAAAGSYVLNNDATDKVCIIMRDSLDQDGYLEYIITQDDVNPVISSQTPSSGSTGLSLTTSAVVVKFGEAMDESSLAGKLSDTGGGGLTFGIPVYDSISFTATYPITSGNLTESIVYSVTLATGVTDYALNAMASSSSWSFTAADSSGPTVNITAPANGSTQVNTISITATANDTLGVSKVEFYIDNILRSTDTSAAYSYSWNTAAEISGSHSLKAIAYDTSSNATTDDDTSVTVRTATPSKPNLAAADDSGASNSDNLTKNTSGLTMTGTSKANATVKLYRAGSTLIGTTTASGAGAWSRNVSLTAGTHSITAKATDAGGVESSASTALSVIVDTTVPATNITAPTNNSKNRGTVTITASASDANGIQNVKIYVDNVLKKTDSASPFNYSWNTTTYSEAKHNLKVVTLDNAGNTRTDNDTSVYVTNSTWYNSGNNLTWLRCSQGQVWNVGAQNCTGTGTSGNEYGATLYQYCSTNTHDCDSGSGGSGGILNDTGTSGVWSTCNNLNSNPAGGYGGRTTWRAPDKFELLNFYNNTYLPYQSLFPATVAYGYWSSSTYVGTISLAWYVSFYGGVSVYTNKSYNYYVRCVTLGP